MTTHETTWDERRSLAKRTLPPDGFCPVCSGFGLETPSEIGPEAEYASIDVGNTERLGGVLCACCREQGVHLADE